MRVPDRYRMVFDPALDDPNPHPWEVGEEFFGPTFGEALAKAAKYAASDDGFREPDTGWLLVPYDIPNIFEQVKGVLRDRRDGSKDDVTDAELAVLEEDYAWDFIGKAIDELQAAIVEGRGT